MPAWQVQYISIIFITYEAFLAILMVFYLCLLLSFDLAFVTNARSYLKDGLVIEFMKL